jgi:hypothetical protein
MTAPDFSINTGSVSFNMESGRVIDYNIPNTPVIRLPQKYVIMTSPGDERLKVAIEYASKIRDRGDSVVLVYTDDWNESLGSGYLFKYMDESLLEKLIADPNNLKGVFESEGAVSVPLDYVAESMRQYAPGNTLLISNHYSAQLSSILRVLGQVTTIMLDLANGEFDGPEAFEREAQSVALGHYIKSHYIDNSAQIVQRYPEAGYKLVDQIP